MRISSNSLPARNAPRFAQSIWPQRRDADQPGPDGWFWFVAEPMLKVLHFFYAIVGNYGVAIIMLTVLVRLCMFPVSRKQALVMQKMQELQPEMKRINEKYKTEPEKKTRATQELFRQHKYNPLGGCLLAFVQLPIFIGLYRSLMVDVELRQMPLFSENIRWASNLAHSTCSGTGRISCPTSSRMAPVSLLSGPTSIFCRCSRLG